LVIAAPYFRNSVTISEQGFQAGSRVFTTDTWVPVSNFHAIPGQKKYHSHFSKLNDEVWSQGEYADIGVFFLLTYNMLYEMVISVFN